MSIYENVKRMAYVLYKASKTRKHIDEVVVKAQYAQCGAKFRDEVKDRSQSNTRLGLMPGCGHHQRRIVVRRTGAGCNPMDEPTSALSIRSRHTRLKNDGRSEERLHHCYRTHSMQQASYLRPHGFLPTGELEAEHNETSVIFSEPKDDRTKRLRKRWLWLID